MPQGVEVRVLSGSQIKSIIGGDWYMKVVCVDNNITDIKILNIIEYKIKETKNRWNITIDKVYEIDHIGMNDIRVINDKGALFLCRA